MSNAASTLTGWRKVVYASPHRKSRFHTESGTLMPLDAWLRVPLTVVERILHLDRNRPWIVPSAIHRLDQIMKPDWRVLELGAGASTGWLAARAANVLSFETSRDWYEEVIKRCNADIRHVGQEELSGAIRGQAPGSFDLVIIDCSGDRFGLIEPSKALVKPGGYLLLDNSDRYPLAGQVLAAWKRETYVGLVPNPLCAQETSIFRHAPFTESELIDRS
jgi:hypothetical protein